MAMRLFQQSDILKWTLYLSLSGILLLLSSCDSKEILTSPPPESDEFEYSEITRVPGMAPTYNFEDRTPKLRPGTDEVAFSRLRSEINPGEEPPPLGIYLLDISSLETRIVVQGTYTSTSAWWSPDTLLSRWNDAWRLHSIHTGEWRDIVAAVGYQVSVNPIDHSLVFDAGNHLTLLDTVTLESYEFGSLYDEPAWHPDGEWIAVSKHVDGYSTQIVVIDKQGSLLFEVTEPVRNHFQRYPSWDSAGERIVFEDKFPDSETHLIPHVAVAEKSGPSSWQIRRLIKGYKPVFDQSGNWIIYSYWSEWNYGESRLFRINVHNGVIQQLTY